MPHVVLDARRIRDFGIGTYIRNLIHGLARLEHKNRYTLILPPNDIPEIQGIGSNFHAAVYPHADTEILHNITFPRFLRTLQADLYHIPLNSVAWWMPQPYVLTIHDMSTLLFPSHQDLRNRMHEQRFRRGALRAACVITVSNSTHRDVETVLHVPPERIRTIYSAPDPAFTVEAGSADHDNHILERYSIQKPFILYAGTIRPQKNIPRLVEAFAVLRGELESRPEFRELRLVIIGDELSKYPAVRRAVVSSRVEQFVRFLGFVSADTLRVFYRAAAVFAFPSLYEGFGLAPLEAMACGTPVVASNLPSLVEAVDDAAELVSPDNVFDIARGIHDILLSEERRQALITAGLAQAKNFHWDRTAQEVLNIYREIKG
ncbi:MAG TPA: glycosyltransferase family 1 protein [Bryobacteraceae bacterium]|nr:glycosyltransferase family 1 protein [Bryobacteraceae bacterium]